MHFVTNEIRELCRFIIRLRISMQIQILMKTIKKIKFKQIFVLATQYNSDYHILLYIISYTSGVQ